MNMLYPNLCKGATLYSDPIDLVCVKNVKFS